MGSGNIKKFELNLGRTGVIIVIAGMTVLLCLSFILGVSVGKSIDTYPDKISSIPQRFLALFWRPAKIAVQQKMEERQEAQQDQRQMDLAFHEALTAQKTPPVENIQDADKAAGSSLPKQQNVKPESPPSFLPPKGKKAPPKQKVSEKKVTVSEKPPAEIKSKIKDAPTGAAASNLFFIHVVSLKDKAKATQIHKAVDKLGYSSKIMKVDLKGKGTWYRVVATGFDSKVKAQAAANRISKTVKTDCIVRSVSTDAGRNQ